MASNKRNIFLINVDWKVCRNGFKSEKFNFSSLKSHRGDGGLLQ